jgi:hypothetical protein
MPNITAYNVDVEVDIDVDDFLSECSSREIKELISALIEDGHLEKHPLIPGQDEKLGVMEEEFLGKLQTISTKYYSMTEEELEMINNLYNKYR